MTAASLQEIICCIGYPVAANPTQYVIEQALVAAGLDFRCLTFDVHPDQLPDAIAGMRAMGFLGAIFADPHQTEIGQYLDDVEPMARQASYVDFAIRVGDQLCGQSTLAAAIAELLTKLERMPRTAIVFGTAQREQLIAAQLVSLGIATTLVEIAEQGDSNLAEVDEQRPPAAGSSADDAPPGSADAAAETEEPVAQLEDDQRERGPQEAEPLVTEAEIQSPAALPPEPARARFVKLSEYESHPQPADLLIAAAEHNKPFAMDDTLLAAASAAMDLTEEPVFTDFLRRAKASGCAVFTSVDVRLAALVIAFRRWTNMEPDDSIMRDALEEFLLV